MKSTKKAFTLIELIIALGIILILLSIGFASYETFDRRNNLVLAADTFKAFVQSSVEDAKGHSSEQSIGSSFTKIILKVDITDGRKVNEYRYNVDGCIKKIGVCEVFNSFTMSSKIIPFDPDTEILTIEVPSGKYLYNVGNVVFKNNSDELVTVLINENSITTTRSF